MFDTININLRSIDTQQLNFVKTVTRDLNVDTTTSQYGTTYTSHIDNLTIRTTAIIHWQRQSLQVPLREQYCQLYED